MRTLNAKNTKRKKYDKADVWRDWARLFDALGGPDRVTWATFSSAAKALVDVEEQALAALWTRADDDKSGELEYKELNLMLRKGAGSEITKANLKRVKQIDRSRGGKLTAKSVNVNYQAARAAALPPMPAMRAARTRDRCQDHCQQYRSRHRSRHRGRHRDRTDRGGRRHE